MSVCSIYSQGTKYRHRLTIQQRRLKNGNIRSVVTSIEELTERRRTQDQTSWLNDFMNHTITHRRMDNSSPTATGLPIGSGAIEIAISRTFCARRGQGQQNLRVKSNAAWWLRESAKTLIRLRARINAGSDGLEIDVITNVVATLARARVELTISHALASVATCEQDSYSFADPYSHGCP